MVHCLYWTICIVLHWSNYPFYYLLFVAFFRDDLYRVELDNMAGDEMFYSKVWLTLVANLYTSANKWKYSSARAPAAVWALSVVYTLQKRTWESNKNDIRVCRMKGKHEVKCSYTTRQLWAPLEHTSSLSRLSRAWTDTAAVSETLFPLGAPAYDVYTNLILLIQNQHIT